MDLERHPKREEERVIEEKESWKNIGCEREGETKTRERVECEEREMKGQGRVLVYRVFSVRNEGVICSVVFCCNRA